MKVVVAIDTPWEPLCLKSWWLDSEDAGEQIITLLKCLQALKIGRCRRRVWELVDYLFFNSWSQCDESYLLGQVHSLALQFECRCEFDICHFGVNITEYCTAEPLNHKRCYASVENLSGDALEYLIQRFKETYHPEPF